MQEWGSGLLQRHGERGHDDDDDDDGAEAIRLCVRGHQVDAGAPGRVQTGGNE